MIPLFSFSGRIRRKDFWITSIILSVAFSVIYGVLFIVFGGVAAFTALAADSDSAESAAVAGSMLMLFGVSAVLFVPYMIASLSLAVRRWHDLNKSGWWVLISFIPIIGGLYAFIMTGFIEGTRGPNGYGEDPKAAERLY